MNKITHNKIKFYSQHGEDCLLWEYFNFKDKGFFLEVGAFDGKYVSNTYSFEQQGWTGICVEPHPEFFLLCKDNRKGSICVNRACVGDEQEEVILQADPTGLFSGLASDTSRKEYVGNILEKKQVDFDNFKAHSVKACRLDDILLEHKEHLAKIDFISIDVEGTEVDVLDGFNLESYSPEIIIVEANSDDHQARLIQYLEDNKYYFSRKLGVNLFFVNSSVGAEKLREIKVHCSIEKQVHPLGKKYSIEGIINGLHIDEEKDSLISKLTEQISKLENTDAWHRKNIEERKQGDLDLLSKKGQLEGQIEWFRKRDQEREKEKENLLKKYNKLQENYSIVQREFTRLIQEPIISKYLILKKFSRGIRGQQIIVKDSSPLSRKKIIVNVQYGLGNRLRALASAQLLAQKTGREFVLLWVPDIHCQARFSDLFINDLNVVDSMDKVDVGDADIYNYMDSEAGSEKNKFINHESEHDIYVKSAFVLNHKYAKADDTNHLVRQLKPVQEIQDIINQFDIHDKIGLHVREGGGRQANKDPWDNSENWSEEGKKNLYYWRDKSSSRIFINELDRLLSEDPSLRFFLAADSEEVYKQFQSRYKDKITFLERNLYDRSVDQQKYALADILLLSRTKYILGSYWSSFSEIAQRFGGNKIRYSGKDF